MFELLKLSQSHKNWSFPKPSYCIYIHIIISLTIHLKTMNEFLEPMLDFPRFNVGPYSLQCFVIGCFIYYHYYFFFLKKILNLRKGVGMGVRHGENIYFLSFHLFLTDEMMTVGVVVPTQHFKTFIDRKGLRIKRNVTTSRSPTVKSP